MVDEKVACGGDSSRSGHRPLSPPPCPQGCSQSDDRSAQRRRGRSAQRRRGGTGMRCGPEEAPIDARCSRGGKSSARRGRVVIDGRHGRPTVNDEPPPLPSRPPRRTTAATAVPSVDAPGDRERRRSALHCGGSLDGGGGGGR